MTRIDLVVVLVLVGLGAVGCGVAPASTETAHLPPSTTATVVSVDHPCTDVDDVTLRSVGLNPGSRQALQPGPDEISACSYSSSEISLTIALSRTSFEDFKASNRGISEGMDFGSRPARMVRRPGSEGTCEMALKSPDGIVLLTSRIPVAVREWGMDQCGGMKDIARAIQPRLGRS